MPGDPDDLHSRCIETMIEGIRIGCLYLPNGNPAPGPKFDYKLEWFKRLSKYEKGLVDADEPVILAGDYNVIPTELDCHKPERWVKDALFFPESRAAYQKLLAQDGLTSSGICIPTKRFTPSGITSAMLFHAMQVSVSTISC